MTISVAIVAMDEEANIGRTLASVAWADEIVLVDSGSKDRTCEIAREHGLHPNSLRAWKALYRAGMLEVPAQSTPSIRADRASATFVPVSIVPAALRARPMSPDSQPCCGAVVQLAFASGASLRIETGALDTALVSALVAELRR